LYLEIEDVKWIPMKYLAEHGDLLTATAPKKDRIRSVPWLWQ
jgi:hypothetical protein